MIAIHLDLLYRLDVPVGSVVAATYDASLIDLDDWVILCVRLAVKRRSWPPWV